MFVASFLMNIDIFDLYNENFYLGFKVFITFNEVLLNYYIWSQQF